MLRELSNGTLDKYNITDEAQLILVGQKSFTLDSNSKGSDINLSTNLLTASKTKIPDYEAVLGTTGFTTGRHYWEFSVDTIVENEDIILGVTTKDANILAKPHDEPFFWGYIVGKAYKLWPGKGASQTAEYGEICVASDVVGVLLEFDNNDASVTFFKNKKCLGQAFTKMPMQQYFPFVSLYYSGVQVTLNTNVNAPISKSE